MTSDEEIIQLQKTHRFPELSNFRSPPAEPVVYLFIIMTGNEDPASGRKGHASTWQRGGLVICRRCLHRPEPRWLSLWASRKGKRVGFEKILPIGLKDCSEKRNMLLNHQIRKDPNVKRDALGLRFACITAGRVPLCSRWFSVS